MKKLILVVFVISGSLFPTKEAQALENADFWYCAAAVAGFDLAALTASQACGAAIVAPSPPTVGTCLIALGATGVAGGLAYLTCSEFLENQCDSGPGTPESEGECSDNDGSPILLDLDRNQFHLAGGPVLFDIDSDGQAEIVTWVASGTEDAFLYLDRNGNGVVDNGLELFGDSTLLSGGDLAENGYEALAEFDQIENGGITDGVIDSGDSIYSDLGVWIDDNADGISDPDEMLSLAEAGVLSIGLDYYMSPRADQFGNEFRYMGEGTIEVNGKPKRMWTTDVFFAILAE